MKKTALFLALLAALSLQSCSSHQELASLKPHRLSSLSYRIEDPSIAGILTASSQRSFLKEGQRYNEKQLGKERERLTKLIQVAGVKDFDKNFISFVVDDTTGVNKYAVETVIDRK